jgi:MFS family permease
LLSQQPDPRGIKFGPFWLVPGISRLNVSTYFYSAYIFVTLVTFLNFVQPYILTEVLGVPVEQQGRTTGYLNFVQECTALLLMSVVGAISDRTGRRKIIVTGFLIWMVGFIVFPLADSLTQLYLYRFIFAIGVATSSVMVIATMQDYPQNISRGKWGGFNSFITSFSILTTTLVLVRLPGYFADSGYPPELAGRYTFWVGAAMALFSAIIFRLGFFGGRIGDGSASKSPFAGAMDGFRAAAGNPRLALTYGSAFAARGDMLIVGAFYSLWFTTAGGEQGIGTAEAIKMAGISMSALLLANVLCAPLFGILLDRINRVKGLCIAMALASIGYFVIGNVSDPFDRPVMMGATFLLGVGEICAIIAGNALLGQEAPKNIRGAAAGVFSLVGTMGILTATVVGGIVFDLYGPGAPFLMMSFVNAIIVVWALLVMTGKQATPA